MVTELDDDDPMWLVNERIKGLLSGDGAGEDHEDVIAWLRLTGLPDDTVARVHKAIVHGDSKGKKIENRDICIKEWLDKTEWVQETEQYGFTLGMHRADALRVIIEKQAAALKMARETLEGMKRWFDAEDNHNGTTFAERCSMCNDVQNQVPEALAAIDALKGE